MDRDSQIVHDRLMYLFPNKVVKGLSTKDRSYYGMIYGYIQENFPEQSMEQYIRSLGFDYVGRQFTVLGEFDYSSAHYLVEHYDDINRSDLGKLLGMSRGRVSQRLQEATAGGADWKVTRLTEEERFIMKIMVEGELFYYEDDGNKAFLTGSSEGPVFLHRNEESVRFHFTFDDETLSWLRSKNRDRMDSKNYAHRRMYEKVTIGGQTYFRTKPKKVETLNVKQYCRIRSLDYENYLKQIEVYPLTDRKTITDEEWFERLLAHVDDDGVLRVPHGSSDQTGLSRRAREFGMNAQEYAEMLGFQWRRRDYASEHQKRLAMYEESILEQSFGGYVYLATDGTLYRSLYYFLRSRSESIQTFLNRLGLERLDKEEYQSRLGLGGALLDKLKELQAVNQNEADWAECIARNRKMVVLLKKLYEYHCQICGEEKPQIPRIEKNDGTFYCEVHHITPLGTAETKSDIETLDHYSNALCLCSYHHSFVHYHKGGFSKMIFDQNELYLVSSQGEKLPILMNKHISVTDLMLENNEGSS
ncbi:HNH endonuclease [Paenibacillus sp. GCM10012306]|uniref:HNH endonuclease n=1 Tax=Paenibacillus sp. GCM10012306 TaxID=3317342 RepID=UPI003611ADD3